MPSIAFIPSKHDAKPVDAVLCEICQANAATARCLQCDQVFCDTCQVPHKKVRATANHQFVDLGSKTKLLLCQQHGLEINTFCLNDETAICAKCIPVSHNGHTFKLIKDLIGCVQDEFTNPQNLVSISFFIFHFSFSLNLI